MPPLVVQSAIAAALRALPDKPACEIAKSDYPASMTSPSLKPLVRLLQKIRSGAQLGFSKIALVALVWLLLWPTRIAISLCPLRLLSRFFGHDCGADAVVPIVCDAQIARAYHIRTAIMLAVKYSPSSANCYPQAFLARILLMTTGIPHALFFGLERRSSASALKAHAWVMVGPVAVTGGHSFENHAVVRCYATYHTNR